MSRSDRKRIIRWCWGAIRFPRLFACICILLLWIFLVARHGGAGGRRWTTDHSAHSALCMELERCFGGGRPDRGGQGAGESGQDDLAEPLPCVFCRQPFPTKKMADPAAPGRPRGQPARRRD